ncbi:hypothetical protein P5F73_08970 [Clostridium perfringens]|nr:hypothetical protein [Clostridium perfringens]
MNIVLYLKRMVLQRMRLWNWQKKQNLMLAMLSVMAMIKSFSKSNGV